VIPCLSIHSTGRGPCLCGPCPWPCACWLLEASTIDFPRQGVRLRSPARRCYTAQGVLCAQPREFFGSYAERELRPLVGAKQSARTVKLSDGDVCDLRQPNLLE